MKHNTEFEVVYSPKRPKFSQIYEGGLDNGDFLFFKIFKNVITFLSKEQLDGFY